jgi:hypothetical protein
MELLPEPGQSTFSGAGGGVGSATVGVGLTSTGLGLALALVGLGDCDLAAIEPGEAPMLHALTSTSNAARRARPFKLEPA